MSGPQPDFRLARLHWKKGQVLQPVHFVEMEEGLLAQFRFSQVLSGLPWYGVANLDWDAERLKKGVLSINSLTLVWPDDSRLIVAPNNAQIVNELKLVNDLKIKEGVTVYLHLLKENLDARGIPLYEQDQSGVKTSERIVGQIALSFDPERDLARDALTPFALARFKQATDETWTLAEELVPPLLQVGSSPFLQQFFHPIPSTLMAFADRMSVQLKDTFVSESRRATILRTIVSVRRLQALCADLESGVYPHPHLMFGELRDFYLSLCCYQNVEPGLMPSYDHDELGAGFNQWWQLLAAKISFDDTPLRYEPFERRENRLEVSPLPKEITDPEKGRDVRSVYVLVRRNIAGTPVPMNGVKIASKLRLPEVLRLALTGIAYERLTNLPFPHGFDRETDFYKLTLGEEWRSALRDDGIAFHAPASMDKDTAVSLYWRGD